jgi:GGDEF domain-containing protein
MENPSTQSGNPGQVQDRWLTLAALAEHEFPHATQFFNQGLDLLVKRLGVDRAAMTRVASHGLETCWWALGEGIGAEDAIHETDEFFSPRVMDDPTKVISIPDLQANAELAAHPSARRLGIRTYLGLPLRMAGKCIGILSLQSLQPRTFTTEELAFARVMACLFTRTLDSETLRDDLQATRNVLDLTAAVVEDHSLESPTTRLPNRRYLEIWLKAHLYLAQRRGEPMSVAHWLVTLDPETKQGLREIAAALRGEDLLVDLGNEEVLLLLPHTGIEGAQVLLERIRTVLGPIPMGATLWQPLHPVDSEDLAISQALLRASEARNYSEETAVDGLPEVQWMLLEMEAEQGESDTQ